MTEGLERMRPKAEDRFRMEFVRIPRINETTGVAEYFISPDPDRYELVEFNGQRVFRDNIDGTQITYDAAMKMARASLEMTPVSESPRITDATEYVASRAKEIDALLDGRGPKPTFNDRSESFLRSIAETESTFVVLYVDLVGSTKLSQTLSPEDNSRVVRTFLREAAGTVVQFNGLVLKYAGDAVIAYFPEPSFILKNDLAIDCALTLLLLVRSGLNPALEAHGLPPVDVRIGIEAGDARVETVGNEEMKEHKDLLGFVMNVAAKIQGLAQPGGICVGEISERNMHTRWRRILKPVELPEGWPFRGKVFRVVLNPTRSPRI